jgi:hypothetical protein
MKLFTNNGFLLMLIILMTILKLSRTTFSKSHPMADMAEDDDEINLEQERRSYDLNKLRHFLLTADAEERAAKREQQEFYKRELVN